MADSPPPKEESFKLYPERRLNKHDYSAWEKLFRSSNYEYHKLVCESNVSRAFNENPILKILKGALKKAGCPVVLKRNVVCEDCSSLVQGGFDAEYNQIVVCKNNRKARNHPETILIHEMIHMFDYCTNDVDFKNLEHLACTEIRAANLAHCSFLSSVFIGQSSPINIKKTHQYCVKMKASQSLMASRNIDLPTAVKYITRVFDRCYNDLEPVGRRIWRKSDQSFLAYEEARCFKIFDP